MKKPLRITGFSKDEVQKRVNEALELDSTLKVKVEPKLVKDGRMFVSAKWIAVLGK